MFTGIIEAMGKVSGVSGAGSNKSFWISSPISRHLKVDQSIAHNGVCLTVEELRDDRHRVTAVQETLEKTDLEQWGTGTAINLERSLLLNSRLDGHFVQGHVDTRGGCVSVLDRAGSFEISFSFPTQFASLLIEKGSICVNGVSLTAYQVGADQFTVSVIPYTWEHTNLRLLKPGATVNLEFDLIGKYIHRKLLLTQ
jgi:riboflavin synthase